VPLPDGRDDLKHLDKPLVRSPNVKESQFKSVFLITFYSPTTEEVEKSQNLPGVRTGVGVDDPFTYRLGGVTATHPSSPWFDPFFSHPTIGTNVRFCGYHGVFRQVVLCLKRDNSTTLFSQHVLNGSCQSRGLILVSCSRDNDMNA
jgi:hypothetical protein